MTESSPERKPIGKITRDGCLDLSGRNFNNDSLKRLGVQPLLKALILSDTQITNFRNLKPQPNLETIVAINCPVEFLNGLSEQQSLKHLDLSRTPVSKKNNFRLLTLATVGYKLSTINNIEVTQSEVKQCKLTARKNQSQLLISNEEDSENELTEEMKQSKETLTTVYVKEHKKLFQPLAENKAILRDLTLNGPLPVIDEFSTDADIKKAISMIQKRNKKLRDEIRDKCNELGVDCPIEE